MKCAIWASQRILTVSHAAKEEITEYIGADPDTIDITSAAPNAISRQCHDNARTREARSTLSDIEALVQS
jgi:hypothetical protein